MEVRIKVGFSGSENEFLVREREYQGDKKGKDYNEGSSYFLCE